ncbi:MAG: hypothetical protein LBT53_03060 [Puniceicoccales bacterium]|jgi:hypothetical protein|nr:hypothetical protein [Puniceicoccales bacterium]
MRLPLFPAFRSLASCPLALATTAVATTTALAAFSAAALAGPPVSGKPLTPTTAALEQNFATPPPAARPGVYWYFMDGNLSRDGITKDLEAMKKAGIGHVIFLEVNVGVPRGKVDYFSKEWLDTFGHAHRECERLGISMLLGTGPGWAGSGAPWVKASQSMQHLVHSQLDIAGGKGVQTFSLPLPAPKRPFFGEGAFTPTVKKQWQDFYEDVAVLAFPAGATCIDQKSVSGRGYFAIPEIEERALYYRKPYSSVAGVPQYIPLAGYLAPRAGDVAVRKNAIKDLTALLKPDGSLTWDAPAGDWTIMRFGSRNNGNASRPAPVPGVGLEANKFDADDMRAHLDNFTGKLFAHIGFKHARADGAGLQTLHIDSWEMGSQNWTRHFRREFTRLRGYDPLPFYPAYRGVIIESREVTERFLWDLRLTSQDLIKENHVAFVKKYGAPYGLNVSIEPYDMNPAADLELASVADLPMAEFWSIGRGLGTEWSAAEATSIAHLIGQPVVGAESFTAHGDGWRQHPASVKDQGDWAFAAGVNRFFYHTYQHQALPDHLRPGMTMGPYGVHWDRNQTWWPYSGGYHRYVARCQYLLQQGRAVADVLYLAPEGAPHVFRAPDSAYSGNNAVPDRRGYNFDACPPSLLYTAVVKDGKIVFPSGAAYRLLALPAFDTMTPALLRKIISLVQDGATLVGLPPQQSPSLVGYPACDAEVRLLAKTLWGTNPVPATLTGITFHKGRVFYGKELRTKADRLYPRYELTAAILDKETTPDFETDGEVRHIHRTLPAADIYFVANRTDKEITAECKFRVTGKHPELWNPITGERRPLPEYKQTAARTLIPLRFDKHESYFIVFREKAADGGGAANAGVAANANAAAVAAKNFPAVKPVTTLNGAWEVAFAPQWGGPAKIVFDELTDWTKHPAPGIRAYSGTAIYKKQFDAAPAALTAKKLYLDLGVVKNIARVRLNGKDLGDIWTSPWRVDISGLLRPKDNHIEIEVANLWANRLIADDSLPAHGPARGQSWSQWLDAGAPLNPKSTRLTFATARHFRKTTPILPSGLLGPVTLLAE